MKPVSAHADVTEPLSVTALSKRCMDNPQVALLVLERFECQLRADIGGIESRLTSSDAAEIARIAHSLKGAAGAAGADGVQAAAAAVESVAKRAEMSSIMEQVRVLRGHVEACLKYIPAARRAVSGVSGGQSHQPESQR